MLLSHANIMANIRAIACGIAIGPDDVAVSWLPLYHDMGLIGSWLATLSFGIPIVILSPLAFLARPARWLWALHAHRGTLSAAPNFAFELCVRRVADEEIRGLDLGAWRAAFNGAEPVSPDTMDRFTRRFAPYGFKPEAMCPVYGLAESAAALTVPPLTRGPWVERVARSPSSVPARRARRPPMTRTPCASSRAAARCRSMRCGSSTLKAGRCASVSRAGCSSGVPRSPRDTSGTSRRPAPFSRTVGWIRVISAT